MQVSNSLNSSAMQEVAEKNVAPSFCGEIKPMQEEKSNTIDMCAKVGLAIAAAAGIGLAIKTGKALKVAREAAEGLQKNSDDAKKLASEAVEGWQKNLDGTVDDAFRMKGIYGQDINDPLNPLNKTDMLSPYFDSSATDSFGMI